MNSFDSIRDAQAPGQPMPETFERTVGCPNCHQSSGSFAVGREGFEFCSAHKVCWKYHDNPYSVSDETALIQRKKFHALGVEEFELVKPWMAGAAGGHPLVGMTISEIAALSKAQAVAPDQN